MKAMGLKLILAMALAVSMLSCTKKSEKESLWIYTSLYRDTINDLTPKLKKEFPNVEFKWFQAGSEEIATKVNAELLAGGTQADVLISSDRFWYEEMAKAGKLMAYKSPVSAEVPDTLRHSEGFYTTLSIPVMVLCYNNEAIKDSEAPKSFKELTEKKWLKQFTTGSPLASGTNFTTMATLQFHYGWDFIKGLVQNETIFQGGNSSVLRRIQNKERPVGWVLLENVLRFQDKDKRLKVIYPDDGVVLQSNVMAITQKEKSRDTAKKFVDFMFGPEGQKAMVRSYMYSPLEKYDPPKGAPKFAELKNKSFPWSDEFINKIVETREEIKEKFSQMAFE